MHERNAALDDWLRAEVRASISDKRPPTPIDEVFNRVRAKIARTSKTQKRGGRKLRGRR